MLHSRIRVINSQQVLPSERGIAAPLEISIAIAVTAATLGRFTMPLCDIPVFLSAAGVRSSECGVQQETASLVGKFRRPHSHHLTAIKPAESMPLRPASGSPERRIQGPNGGVCTQSALL
jgi:hypothetical protein